MGIIYFLIISFFSFQALAQTTYVIPNPYKNRKSLSAKSVAVGWSQRNRAGFEYQKSKSKEETDGVKSGESDDTLFTPFLFGSSSGLSTEIFIGDLEFKDDFNSTETETDLQIFKFAILPPQSNFVFGLDYANAKSDSNSEVELKSIGLGFGFKSPTNVYFGFGLDKVELSVNNTDLDEDGDVTFQFGAGIVQKDIGGEALLFYTNEEDVKTYEVLSTVYINSSPANQFIGTLSIESQKGGDDDEDNLTISINAGADIDYQKDFYFAPSLERVVAKSEDNDPTDDKTVSTELGLELGYRKSDVNIYFALTISDEKTEDNVANSDVEDKGSGYYLGANLNF